MVLKGSTGSVPRVLWFTDNERITIIILLKKIEEEYYGNWYSLFKDLFK